MCKSRFVGCTIIGIWTIIQSVFHLLFSFYGFSFYLCHFLPSYYYLVFIYLTYFYNHQCEPIELDSYNYFFELSRKDGNENDTSPFYNFVADVLNHAQFPAESTLASRTNIYLLSFIIMDVCWIVASVVLLTGNFFNVTKIRSILFYLPWILVSIIVNIFDVVAAVHFGFDIRACGDSLQHWLKFVGITNPEIFTKYEDPQLGLSIHASVPSAIISAISCRLLIFWIFNVICLFQVCNYSLHALRVNQVPYRSKSRRHHTSAMPGTSRSTLTSQLNTSEARIRQWQLFYGSSEINSTTESAENETVDVNSNCRSLSRSLSSPMLEMNKPTTSTFAVQRHMSFNGNTYHQFSDVAEYVGVVEVRNTPMKTLRGQMPWSYVHGLDERKLDQTKLAKSRHESVTAL